MKDYLWRLLRWLRGKDSTCQCRSCKRCGFDPCVWKIPWRRIWQPIPVFLPEESQGQRSLAGYSPRSHKEVDTTEVTEYTHTHTHTHTHTSLKFEIIWFNLQASWSFSKFHCYLLSSLNIFMLCLTSSHYDPWNKYVGNSWSISLNIIVFKLKLHLKV